MTALVTGGAGFIGSHVAEQLRDRGHHVVVLDDLSGGFVENVPEGVELVTGSILDVDLVERIFRQHPVEHVFHLAAYAAEGLSHFIRRYNYSNNVLGSMNLINAALRSDHTRMFVFTSSIAVYGEAAPPMVESDPCLPKDPYGVAKLSVELDLQAAHDIFGLPFVIFRPHNVYGERQNIGDRYRNVVGIFMNQALKGEPFTIFGDGTQERAFTYIRDISDVIASSIDNPLAAGQVFNVGGDTPCTVNELAEVVARTMDVPLRIDHLEERQEAKFVYATHDKVRHAFPSEVPPTDLARGLQPMADWARRRGAQEPSIFRGIEVARNMPPSWAALTR